MCVVTYAQSAISKIERRAVSVAGDLTHPQDTICPCKHRDTSTRLCARGTRRCNSVISTYFCYLVIVFCIFYCFIDISKQVSRKTLFISDCLRELDSL